MRELATRSLGQRLTHMPIGALPTTFYHGRNHVELLGPTIWRHRRHPHRPHRLQPRLVMDGRASYRRFGRVTSPYEARRLDHISFAIDGDSIRPLALIVGENRRHLPIEQDIKLR